MGIFYYMFIKIEEEILLGGGGGRVWGVETYFIQVGKS